MFNEQNLEFLRRHKGKILAVIFFLILGLLFVTIGFYQTFFVLFLLILGIAVGVAIDNPDAVRNFINNFLGR